MIEEYLSLLTPNTRSKVEYLISSYTTSKAKTNELLLIELKKCISKDTDILRIQNYNYTRIAYYIYLDTIKK